MNFIKKKLKTHKKDDEEEEYEKAVAEQSLRPVEQKNKNTEEWQFFQQLSMKVQDTVQKTQTSLNKLKDVRQDSYSGTDDRDSYDVGNGNTMQDFTADSSVPFGASKVTAAPPRPPPPGKIGFDADADFASSSPAKGPPRPPPPVPTDKDVHSDLLSDSFSQPFSAKSSSSPARPPPPSAAKAPAAIDDFGFGQPPPVQSGGQQSDLSFSLLDEFGFQTESQTSTTVPGKANFQDLLFLDVKEHDDPFDTSFVDVNKIVSHGESVAGKASESVSNPFAGMSHTQSASKENKEFESPASKKQATNPFFAASESKNSTEPQGDSLWSSHNPFSDSKTTAANDSLMGDDLLLGDILSSSDRTNIIGDTFKKNEISLVTSLGKIDEPKAGGVPLSGNNALNLDDILCVAPTEEPVPQQPVEPKVGGELLNSWLGGDDVNSVPQPAVSEAVKRASVTGELDFFSDSLNSAPVKPHVNGAPPLPGSRKSSAASVASYSRKSSGASVTQTVASKAEIMDLFESGSALDKPVLPLSDQLNHAYVSNGDQNLDTAQDILQPKLESPIQPKLDSPVQQKLELESPVHQKLESPIQPMVESPLHPRWDSPVQSKLESPMTSEHEDKVDMERKESLRAEEIKLGSHEQEVRASDFQETSDSNIPTPGSDAFTQPFTDTAAEEAPKSSLFGDNQAFTIQKTDNREPDPDFDAFALKFENVGDNSQNDLYDPFSGGKAPTLKEISQTNRGFDSMDEFDPFKAPKMTYATPPPPPPVPVMKKDISRDSFDEYDNEQDFSVVIKPKVKDSDASQHLMSEPPKLLPPPPKTPTKAFDSSSPRFNPFDKDSLMGSQPQTLDLEKTTEAELEEETVPALGEASVRKSDSVESPLSPLFDEDTSQPLEEFPKRFTAEGWEMVLRQPNKKKLTGNRFWKKIFVKLSENSVLQLFNKSDDKLPFQELPLQACYSLSEIGAQQYDQYGKIFTVKLQYRFYRERVGVRPGQISKVTQGQVTSMGDVAKLGLPLQHSPQTSQLLKLGTHSYADIKTFILEVEDVLFKMVIHRDRVLTYKTEEVQVIAQDEFYVEQTKTGHVEKQLARVRIFFLAFITGMPNVEVGLNDINRQGKEVVGRYDIIPVVTEEWIRLEDVEFHSCIMQEEFKNSRIIKFIPPDACLFELLRFRIRPPRNRELPLQVRVFMTVTNTRVEIRSDILVPGYSSRKQGQVPCENIQIRFPIPECWIYLFRTEKHFRYGSKKSTARRPGKIKGLERIIGAAQNLDPSLIEVSAGQAKYEHVFHAVVWRIPRLPKEGQGAYTQQLFLLRTELTSFDQIPESFEQYVDVEFTMPATYVSHTTVRSVSVSNPTPPEKYVRYISKHEYKVEIDFKSPDDIEGLMPSTPTIPTTSATVVESTEDEKDEEEDSD